MILEIKVKTKPIDIYGTEVEDMGMPAREVYINGERCPPGLERIILTGMDSLTAEYVEEVLTEMKRIPER